MADGGLTVEPSEKVQADLHHASDAAGRAGSAMIWARLQSRRILAVCVVVLLLIAAGTIRARGKESHTMYGTITLDVGAWWYASQSLQDFVVSSYSGYGGRDTSGTATLPAGAQCVAGSGFYDIDDTAEVTVKNQSGDIIATGMLRSGHTNVEVIGIKVDSSGLGEKVVGAQCVFDFTVPDVPRAKFYTIEIGRRQGPTFSYSEIAAVGWRPGLVLG
jgi:hypothetical protein